MQHTKTRRLAVGIKEDRDALWITAGRDVRPSAADELRLIGRHLAAGDQEAEPGPTAASLEAMSFQIALGEPFRIDASPLPGSIGELPLEGNIILKFLSLERDLTVLPETIPLVATGYAGDPATRRT